MLVALLLVSTYGALSHTPKKLDQRLVGRWGYEENTSSYSFFADGRGRWAENLDGSGRGHNFEWWIDGDVLVMESRFDAVTNFTRALENKALRIARSVAPRRLVPSIWNPDDNEGHRYFALVRVDPDSIACQRVKNAVPDPKRKTGPDGSLQVLTRQPL